mgnify:CR=1 FL=1
MTAGLNIIEVTGREIFDGTGNLTIEAEVILENGAHGRAAAPSDGITDVNGASDFINYCLSEAILFEDATDQNYIDKLLEEEIGKQDMVDAGVIEVDLKVKKRAALAVSMAAARAAGAGLHLPLYRYLGGSSVCRLPVPMIHMISGGGKEENAADMAEFMVVPVGANSLKEGLYMGAEIYHTLKRILAISGYADSVDEKGGFRPPVLNSEQVLQSLIEAIQVSGYKPGKDVMLAIDAGAGALYETDNGVYSFPKESRMRGVTIERDSRDMISYCLRLIDGFFVCYLEDVLWENDWEGYGQMNKVLGNRCVLAGDDLFHSDAERIAEGGRKQAVNGAVIHMSQAGTVTKTIEAVDQAKRQGLKTILSFCSGETEDMFLSDIAAALSVDYIKIGAPSRGEYTAKYNELLRIEEIFGKNRSVSTKI